MLLVLYKVYKYNCTLPSANIYTGNYIVFYLARLLGRCLNAPFSIGFVVVSGWLYTILLSILVLLAKISGWPYCFFSNQHMSRNSMLKSCNSLHHKCSSLAFWPTFVVAIMQGAIRSGVCNKILQCGVLPFRQQRMAWWGWDILPYLLMDQSLLLTGGWGAREWRSQCSANTPAEPFSSAVQTHQQSPPSELALPSQLLHFSPSL